MGCGGYVTTKVKVVSKTFEILEALSEGNRLGLREITEHVSYPKPTVFRLLSTLEQLGYVEQDKKDFTYALSSKLMLLARSLNSGSGLIAVARPHMEMLHKRFGETVNLARLVENRAVYVNIIESNEAFRISDSIGDVAPFHATSIGKAIAAFLPKETRTELFKDYDFSSFTRKTISGVDTLKSQLDEVKKAGYAVDNEEGHDGVICVGAPIFNNDHYAFAALSISMPKVRAKKAVLDDVKAQLPKEGISISLELGVTDIAKCFTT